MPIKSRICEKYLTSFLKRFTGSSVHENLPDEAAVIKWFFLNKHQKMDFQKYSEIPGKFMLQN